ncbi:Serine/threonine-protein kinase SIK1 [Lemmus lemmus]
MAAEAFGSPVCGEAEEGEGQWRAGAQTGTLGAVTSAEDLGASCCRKLGGAPGRLTEAEGRRCWRLLNASVAAPPCDLQEFSAVPSGTGQDQQKVLRVGFYNVERTLGKGNFAVVKLARHRVTKM